MRLTVTFFLVLFSIQYGRSQIGENYALKQRYNLEIIQIEEFIDRFNFEQNTKFDLYLRNNYPDVRLDREQMIRILFDQYDSYLDTEMMRKFISFVNDSTDPKYLHFYDSQWYAEAYCIFENKERDVSVKLYLKNQSQADSSSKWVIAGVSSELFEYPGSYDTSRYLSPVSHGTDFIGLYNALKDRKNLLNYFVRDFEADPMTYFILLLQRNELNLKLIKKVRYHFLTIPGWVFTVDYFNRKIGATGWLISGLSKASNDEKEIYKRDILHLYFLR